MALLTLPLGSTPSFLLPNWLYLALHSGPETSVAGQLAWVPRAEGFQTAELEVFADTVQVDTIHLVRINPALYDFSVHVSPTHPKFAADWMQELGAVAVVNGSYYVETGEPQTPLWSSGARLGPSNYESRHGAFVADAPPRILDSLKQDPAHSAASYKDAMVSYPLLLDEAGNVRAGGRSDWLANRNFVAIDGHGNVLLGTTEEAYFSLTALGNFLKRSPLEIKIALNLDGGPVASQVVDVRGFTKQVLGNWELRHEYTYAHVARQWIWQAIGLGTKPEWKLPIVLAVKRKVL
jgi:hypothetical protein